MLLMMDLEDARLIDSLVLLEQHLCRLGFVRSDVRGKLILLGIYHGTICSN